MYKIEKVGEWYAVMQLWKDGEQYIQVHHAETLLDAKLWIKERNGRIISIN